MSNSKTTPRGIRNNNPLNIRVGNNWVGEVTNPTDHEFEQFTDMKYGLRAAFRVLRNYIVRHRRNTITKIVSAWAPANENNTQRYINFVCAETKMQPDTPIDFYDEDQMTGLVSAMAKMETGWKIPADTVTQAYRMVV